MQQDIVEELEPIDDFFLKTYVLGATKRERRTEIPSRCPPSLWSQYESVLQRRARTNNASEDWHDKFQLVVGKNHPSLYAFFTELAKEQTDTEIMLWQIKVGQKVRRGKDNDRNWREDQILNIVANYKDYRRRNDVKTYNI